MGRTLEWSTAEVDSLVAKLSELTNLVSLSIVDNGITYNHLIALLPRLHSLKCQCLGISGRFGNSGMNGTPQITNPGSASIARPGTAK